MNQIRYFVLVFFCLITIKVFAQDISESARWEKADSVVTSLAIQYMKRQLGTTFYEQNIYSSFICRLL